MCSEEARALPGRPWPRARPWIVQSRATAGSAAHTALPGILPRSVSPQRLTPCCVNASREGEWRGEGRTASQLRPGKTPQALAAGSWDMCSCPGTFLPCRFPPPLSHRRWSGIGRFSLFCCRHHRPWHRDYDLHWHGTVNLLPFFAGTSHPLQGPVHSPSAPPSIWDTVVLIGGKGIVGKAIATGLASDRDIAGGRPCCLHSPLSAVRLSRAVRSPRWHTPLNDVASEERGEIEREGGHDVPGPSPLFLAVPPTEPDGVHAVPSAPNRARGVPTCLWHGPGNASFVQPSTDQL